ncbi:MAG: DUF2062 domain-containing protein [Opitutaceae bacterium]|jgi:hypothetical protein
MPHEEHHRKERFARIRRVKNFLRFMPRRARLHKYPLVGRFAAIARRRSYLWSFKTAHVRPALYAGSVLSLLPFMGVQLPVAFVLALMLRGNFMLLGGLQFITNPVTAVPVYYGTYQLGKAVINVSGFGRSIEVVSDPAIDFAINPDATPDTGSSTPTTDSPAVPPHELRWTQGLGTRINALLLGGVVGGLILGACLDLLWRLGVRQATAHKRKVLAQKNASGSTDTPPKSQ